MAAISSILMAAAGGFGLMQALKKPAEVSNATTAPAPPPSAVATAKDPVAEQAATDAKAAQNTNTALAAKNKARKASSLLAAGDPANADAGAGSALSYGKTTLGG
ncbi:MAG: hypothetical protein V4451_16970 [Pseudomonadota bacterium]